MHEVAFHNWPIKGLCILWIEPMFPVRGDLADIPLEEPAHPVFTCCPLHQIINQGMLFFTCHQVCHVTTPSAPLDDNCLLHIGEQLLAFMSKGWRFVTMEVIEDGGVGNTILFPGLTK